MFGLPYSATNVQTKKDGNSELRVIQDHPHHHLHVICYKSLGMGPTWIWHQMFGILGLPQSTDTRTPLQ